MLLFGKDLLVFIEEVTPMNMNDQSSQLLLRYCTRIADDSQWVGPLDKSSLTSKNFILPNQKDIGSKMPPKRFL